MIDELLAQGLGGLGRDIFDAIFKRGRRIREKEEREARERKALKDQNRSKD